MTIIKKKGEKWEIHNMIRIAVIDDQKEITDHIAGIVNRYFEKCGEEFKVKCYQFPRELIWDLQEKDYYDIFLIDIEMSINGLEVAKVIREMYLEPYIVFITSYVQYSVKGYEYNAYRYIIKEEVDEKLPLALEAMCKKLKEVEHQQYVIESYSKIEKIDYKDIYYVYIDGKYSYFCTSRGSSRVRKPLATVFEELNAPEFVYADKGHVVNLQHVMRLEDRTVDMRNGESVPVSAPQLKRLKQSISDYWRGKL